jgi:hypothetical protein
MAASQTRQSLERSISYWQATAHVGLSLIFHEIRHDGFVLDSTPPGLAVANETIGGRGWTLECPRESLHLEVRLRGATISRPLLKKKVE